MKPLESRVLPGDEVLSPLSLAAMATFALNNAVLKPVYGNWVTGKLSDVAACIFMPLVMSAILGTLGVRLPLVQRVAIGVLITATILTAVNTSAVASGWLDQAVALVLPAQVPNTVDPTDLVALPACAVALISAKRMAARQALRPSKRLPV